MWTLLKLTLIVAFIGGWVANIYKLATCGIELASFGALEVMRIIGIFVAPVGSVLGFC